MSAAPIAVGELDDRPIDFALELAIARDRFAPLFAEVRAWTLPPFPPALESPCSH